MFSLKKKKIFCFISANCMLDSPKKITLEGGQEACGCGAIMGVSLTYFYVPSFFSFIGAG